MSIPNGYHLEGSVRKGPVITGALLLGIPWVLGLSVASIDDYTNSSGWLVLPGVGPWLTLALRKHCSADIFMDCSIQPVARTFLVLDGLMQATGAALLIWGIADKKQRVVRDDVVRVIGVVPTRVGSGYGLDVLGTF